VLYVLYNRAGLVIKNGGLYELWRVYPKQTIEFRQISKRICKETGYDVAYISRLETEILMPPEEEDKLTKLAWAYGIKDKLGRLASIYGPCVYQQ